MHSVVADLVLIGHVIIGHMRCAIAPSAHAQVKRSNLLEMSSVSCAPAAHPALEHHVADGPRIAGSKQQVLHCRRQLFRSVCAAPGRGDSVGKRRRIPAHH